MSGEQARCQACGQRMWHTSDDPDEVLCWPCLQDMAEGLTLEQAMIRSDGDAVTTRTLLGDG